jgi:hypothetical protein
MANIAYTLLIAMAPALPVVQGAVREIEVETSVEMASVFKIKLAVSPTQIGDWSVLQEDIFRPLVPVSVRLQVGTGVPQALINGYVAAHQVTWSDTPGETILEVTGLDKTLLMNLQEKVMPWPSMPDSAIAAAIFGQYTIVPKIQVTPPYLIEPEGTTIQRGSDIRFLRRLAMRNGFDCYVLPEPTTGIDFGHFEPRTTIGVPQAVLSVHMGASSNCSEFKVRYEMLRPTGAIGAGLDEATKAPQPAPILASLSVPMGVEGTLTRIIPPPVSRPADTGAFKNPELQSAVQGIVDRSTWSVVCEGKLDPQVPPLQPGGIVAVRGVGRVYNGYWYVTTVNHVIGQDGYEQRFTARRNAVGMTGAEVYVQP